MMNFFLRLLARLRRWRIKPESVLISAPEPIPEPTPEPEPIPEPKPSKPKRARFTLRSEILDDLPHYFKALKTMQRSDPETFAFYRRVGITLTQRVIMEKDLSPWWKCNRPGFGALAFGDRSDLLKLEQKDHKLFPRFAYFTRYKPALAPPSVQRTNRGDVYVITIYWIIEDEKEKEEWSAPTSYAVCVTADGELDVLRIKLHEKVTVRAKVGHDRGHTFSIPIQRWGLPKFFDDWAQDNHHQVTEHLRHVFVMVANSLEYNNYCTAQVRAQKNGLSCLFMFHIEDSARLFRDREPIIVEGKRKRIFHMVRAHQRADGALVPFHFRGERSFVWNKYDIQITVPGLHHESLLNFHGQAGDEEMLEKFPDGQEWVPLDKLSGLIDEEYEKAKTAPNDQRWLRGR